MSGNIIIKDKTEGTSSDHIMYPSVTSVTKSEEGFSSTVIKTDDAFKQTINNINKLEYASKPSSAMLYGIGAWICILLGVASVPGAMLLACVISSGFIPLFSLIVPLVFTACYFANKSQFSPKRLGENQVISYEQGNSYLDYKYAYNTGSSEKLKKQEVEKSLINTPQYLKDMTIYYSNLIKESLLNCRQFAQDALAGVSDKRLESQKNISIANTSDEFIRLTTEALQFLDTENQNLGSIREGEIGEPSAS